MIFTVSDEQLLAAMAERALAQIPAEQLQGLIAKALEMRIGRLNFEEARAYLKCKNDEQLYRFCREHQIPIRHFGPKKRFILLADIQAADERARQAVPDPDAPKGSKIVSLAGVTAKTPSRQEGTGVQMRKGALV